MSTSALRRGVRVAVMFEREHGQFDEHPPQVFRHVQAVLQELNGLLAAVRVVCQPHAGVLDNAHRLLDKRRRDVISNELRDVHDGCPRFTTPSPCAARMRARVSALLPVAATIWANAKSSICVASHSPRSIAASIADAASS